MLNKAIFSGFGGQGVLMMGYSLSHGAVKEGLNVTFLPSYGAEMRGGTANCTVCISDEEIASPITSTPDFLIVMNIPSLYVFQNRVARGGIIFMNSSIVNVEPVRKDVAVKKVDCVGIAEKFGDARMANVAMMGKFLRETGVVSPDSYLQGLAELLGKKKKGILEANANVFNAAFNG
ncbi:MAG: 2-oxoacid:acceptor oxidoreductase family protein [Deltaproteobacteria bacterium]|nr:2-oxoacid:acceptor oxidoreductase family protein [Deltaproteobacteria bacterium]